MVDWKIVIQVLVRIVVAVALLAACSPRTTEVTYPDSSGESFDNPGTLATQPKYARGDYLLDISVTVAFLDACISDSGLVGPCHCAADLLVDDVDSSDIAGLEERISVFNDFPPELAGLLVQCRGEERPPTWSAATKEAYIDACTKGSNRLVDLCRCSAFRAADVIPEDRLPEFLVATDLRPNLVDLIKTCL